MNYTGIDYHKRYSVACTLDAQGRLLKQARIDQNARRSTGSGRYLLIATIIRGRCVKIGEDPLLVELPSE